MKEGLQVVVENGSMIIRIPIPILAWAAEHSDNLEFNGKPVKIADQDMFARSVMRALEDEGEDGSTPVTHLFDSAFDWVLEQGEDGPDYGEEEY